MAAEGNETPGGEPPRRSEGDLLAERRARRAAESGEHALTVRAESAEATVRTLESHVASLQQRLDEAAQEQRRLSELIQAERASLSGEPGSQPGAHALATARPETALERELRRVRQREYAEQRLRVEVEERLIELERESRAELEALSRSLSASEHEARGLAARLESVQRELAEVEQGAAAERSAVRRAEHLLQAKVDELELRVVEIHRGLDAERAARGRSERLLESMRVGHRRVEGLVVELRGLVTQVKHDAASAPPQDAPAAPKNAISAGEQDALRIFGGEAHGRPRADLQGANRAEGSEVEGALSAAAERLRASAQEQAHVAAAVSPARPPSHKHSMSLITRVRRARKQRRQR